MKKRRQIGKGVVAVAGGETVGPWGRREAHMAWQTASPPKRVRGNENKDCRKNGLQKRNPRRSIEVFNLSEGKIRERRMDSQRQGSARSI